MNEPLLILSDDWTGLLAEYFLKEKGLPCRRIQVQSGASSPPLPVYLGNGEYVEKSKLVYGERTTELLWKLSTQNHKLFGDLLIKLKVPLLDQRMTWTLPKEEKIEPALVFDFPLFLEKLSGALGEETSERKWTLDAFESKGSFCYELKLSLGEQTRIEKASAILWLSDSLAKKHIESFQEVFIPAWLPFLRFSNENKKSFLRVYNGGIDYAFSVGSTGRIGSFRSLYQDQAVEKKAPLSPKARDSLVGFFEQAGAVKQNEVFSEEFTCETLSCDGLPVVGAPAEYPGVMVVGGFSGRTPNFIAAIFEQLGGQLGAERSGEGLLPFLSPRRMV